MADPVLPLPPGKREEEQHDHVVSLGTYVAVFLALLVGTGLTVFASYVDLGPWNTPVALAIAISKASLVVLFFMHLKYGSRLLWVWLGAAAFFLILLLSGTASDVLAHLYLSLGSPGT